MDNKVFCIGLSRTGTTSLCHALNILGIQSVHYPVEIFVSPHLISDQLKFKPTPPSGSLHRKRRYTAQVESISLTKSTLSQHRGFTDLPVPMYFRELSERFPQSKFIYTTRNLARWIDSMHWLYTKGKIVFHWGLLDEQLLIECYGTRRFNKEILAKAYTAHESAVKEFFASQPDKLLTLNLDDGELNFPLLCKFLGYPIPDCGFPRDNTRKSLSLGSHLDYYATENIPLYGKLCNQLRRAIPAR